uniref:RING-CH-type domain-containing protein n=1 Tax=Skeletonema marinoi TaxID=267567 RepID=A0A7S2M7F6_9STRA
MNPSKKAYSIPQDMMEMEPTGTQAQAAQDDTSSSSCCWLCLGEGPDASGMPLVRNCSCRGSSGFAHLSCIIRYAEIDGRNSYQSMGNIGAAFQECPNCKQEFQNDLRYHLERARVSFVEREFSDDHMLYLRALIHRVRVLNAENDADKAEGDQICFKMVSTIEEMKSDHSESEWSGEFMKMEAVVMYVIGLFHMNVGSEESLQEALEYFGSAIYLFTLLGDEINIISAKKNIAKIEAKFSGEEISHDEGNDLEFSKRQYKYWLGKLGEQHPITIRRGELLAHALYCSNQGVAAERLLAKMAALSRQVHGPTHNCTLSATSALKDVKDRRVFIDSRRQWFHALKYENDGLSCVVRGPVVESAGGSSSSMQEEHMLTLSLPITDVFPGPGTPVVCQGLSERAHLNGKIGDTRGFNGGKFEVHFEEAGLEPAIIKHENLRIVFELP